ncbi:MAG: tetratricopeptide repeat protein [Nitrospirota bacterium]
MRGLAAWSAAVLLAAIVWGCGAARTSAPVGALEPDTGAPPQEVAAYHLVEDGRRQLEEGRTASAVATFQKAMALAPSSPHANLALAEAKLRQGEFRTAVVYADRLQRLAGDRPEWRWRAALVRAQAYEGLGDATRAKTEFTRVLDDDPTNEDARTGLGRLESEGQFQ